MIKGDLSGSQNINDKPPYIDEFRIYWLNQHKQQRLINPLNYFSHTSNNRTITEPLSRLSDDPFVTCDDNLSTNTSTPTSLKKQDSIESSLKDVGYKKRNSKSLPLRNDGTLDYDGELSAFPMINVSFTCRQFPQQSTRMNLTMIYLWNRMVLLLHISCLRWKSAWIWRRSCCPLSFSSVDHCSKCTLITLPIRICS